MPPIDKSSSCRVAWIDYAKAIGIFLVVIGHLYPFRYPIPVIRTWIYYFHMPLFFFISGCFHRDTGFKTNFVKGIKSLIIPAVAWNGLWWLLGLCDAVPYVRPVNLLLALPLERESYLPCNVTWFLFACFYCKIMMALFLNKWTRVGLLLIWMAGFATIHHYAFAYLGSAIMAFPFYAIGYYFFEHRTEVVRSICGKTSTLIRVIAILFSFLCFVSAPAWYGYTSTMARKFGSGMCPSYIAVPTMYVLALFGIATVLIVSYKFSKSRIHFKMLEYIGANTLVIMCVHGLGARFGIVQFDGVRGLLVRIPIAISLVLMCLVVARILRRFHLTIFTGIR